MGIGAAKDDKRVNYEFDLQAIGFLFNLRKEVWRVGPKRRGILKMFLALFIIFPINFTDEQASIRIQRIKLLQVASLINWYAQVIPAGSSFVHSLYRNAGWGADSTLVEVNINTKRDVHWWRLLIIASLKNPDLFSARISHLRVNIKEDISLYTDASSEVGEGAWLSGEDAASSLGPQNRVTIMMNLQCTIHRNLRYVLVHSGDPEILIPTVVMTRLQPPAYIRV